MNGRVLCALFLTVFVAFTACNHENMSTVTIHFGEIPLAKAAEKQDLFDRLLGFFLPRAHAAWTENYNTITLTVTGEDMDTITAPVSPGSSSFTIEVPMGKSRLFTLIANDGTVKKWGGKVLADTSSSSISLSLNVFPIVTNFGIGWLETGSVNLEWDCVPGSSGYHVYSSRASLGPYTRLGSFPGDGNPGPVDETWSVESGTNYFKISAYYPQGESEPCDPIMVVVP